MEESEKTPRELIIDNSIGHLRVGYKFIQNRCQKIQVQIFSKHV